MKIIIINSPKYGRHEVMVDDEDYERVKKYTWTLQKHNGGFIVCAWIKDHTEKLHRFLLDIPYKSKIRTIHLDGNNFNNQKSNIKAINKCEFCVLDHLVKMTLRSHRFGEHVVLFDLEFYDQFKSMTWRLVAGQKTLYCAAIGPNNSPLQMHRLVLKINSTFQVDHKDGNGLNNRKINLRPATLSQNKMNSPKRRNNKTGYKGVQLSGVGHTYQVNIRANKKHYYGGTFSDPISAAKKYNEMALKYHGEFANLNPIPNE